MLQGVPLFIANDTADHGGPVSRALVYAAYRGIEGVLGSTDFRVQETGTPGGSVDILPGVYAALARGPSQDLQSYSGAALTTTNLTIPATDSSGSRSDLIIVNVEDPNDGTGQWSTPSDAVNGPYEHIRRVDNVPSGTTSVHDLSGSIGTRNAVTLARIDLPSSTGTVTNSEITDLRELAAPLTLPVQRTTDGPSTTEEVILGSGYQPVPSTGSITVRVPPYAVMMDVDITNKPMRLHDPDAGSANRMWGRSSFRINGGSAVSGLWYNRHFSGPFSELWTGVAQSVDVTSYQGQDITIEVMHSLNGNENAPNGVTQAYSETSTIFRLNFRQELA